MRPVEGRDRLTVWLDTNVLHAAKARIRHVLNLYDSVSVAFSGGKDSLTVLHLVKEVYEEEGIKKPVDALFRDEELIPDSVVDFVNGYRQQPWLKLLWFAVPLKSSKYILGKTFDYVQWDPNRAHVRPRPPWGITHEDPTRVFDQYSMDDYAASYYRGKVCVLTGIRASESLVRLRAIVNKRNDPTVAATSSKRVMMGRPIYDWSEHDVFRYFYDRGITYCPIYDAQVFNQEQLRVSTPLHAENAKRMSNLRTRDPEFYGRVLQVFPEVAVQERYYAELDTGALIRSYPQTFSGVKQFIEEHITDEKQNALAMKRFNSVLIRARKDPRAYTPAYLLRVFATGAYKREILPQLTGRR